MAIAYQYDASGYFAGEVDDYGLLPNNSTYIKPPSIQVGKWPCWNGKDWIQVEDHRERESYPELVARYGEQYSQKATEYWLPEDTHNTPARTMKEGGALPKGALLERPAATTEQIAEQVRAKRDAKIEAVRWRIERHKDELELGITLTEPLEPLLQYVQALRDVPQQDGFPENVEWPVEL